MTTFTAEQQAAIKDATARLKQSQSFTPEQQAAIKDATARLKQSPKESIGWNDVAARAISNTPRSALEYGKGVKEMVTNPLGTAMAVGDVIHGALLHALPSKTVDYLKTVGDAEKINTVMQMASNVGGHFKQYTSEEGIKKAISENPVQTMADLSTVFGLVGKAAEAGNLAKTAKVASKAAQYTDPLSVVTQGGRLANETIIGSKNYFSPKMKVYAEATEGKVPEIIEALRKSKPIIPGSKPTAAQAASGIESTKFSALGKFGETLTPTEMETRNALNREAQVNVLSKIAKDEKALKKAEELRDTESGKLYKISNAKSMKITPEMSYLMGTPAMRQALTIAKEIAANKKIPLLYINPKTGVYKITGEGANIVKKAFDTLIQSPQTYGLGAEMTRDIASLKNEFIGHIEKQIPEYGQARTKYAELSKPIDQMKIAKQLREDLKNTLTETDTGVRANKFAESLKNAASTIKKATGDPRFTDITEIMTPEQLKQINTLREDLKRTAKADYLGVKGKKGDFKSLIAPLENPPLHILDRAATVVTSLYSTLRGKVNKKVLTNIVAEMMNPETVIPSLEKLKKTEEATKVSRESTNYILNTFKIPGVSTIPNVVQSSKNEKRK